MARKKNKSGSGGGDKNADAAEAVPADTKGGEDMDEAAEDASSTEVELLQVDVGDVIKLKQVLDESVAGALLDLDGPALQEDHKSDNIKLCIMVLACCFAFVAQFAPLPFPESRPVLGLCCISYFVLSGILQLVTTFHDKDCIMVTQPVDKAKYPTKNKEVEEYGIRVRTQLPRFSEFYTVIMEFQGYGKDGKKAASGPYVSKTWSVGQFFDVDGFFAEDILMDEVEALYANFCEGKFGKPEDYDDGSHGILHLLGFEGLEKSLKDKKKATSGKLKAN
mmetsp:Transcript_34105/g.74765  ORF Transcript_34105/g.74765 Transcript_34105/m.74765 type:complete len:278 (+) Transcript_34105:154-987(+)